MTSVVNKGIFNRIALYQIQNFCIWYKSILNWAQNWKSKVWDSWILKVLNSKILQSIRASLAEMFVWSSGSLFSSYTPLYSIHWLPGTTHTDVVADAGFIWQSSKTTLIAACHKIGITPWPFIFSHMKSLTDNNVKKLLEFSSCHCFVLFDWLPDTRWASTNDVLYIQRPYVRSHIHISSLYKQCRSVWWVTRYWSGLFCHCQWLKKLYFMFLDAL